GVRGAGVAVKEGLLRGFMFQIPGFKFKVGVGLHVERAITPAEARSKERSCLSNSYIAICAKKRAGIAKFFWLAREFCWRPGKMKYTPAEAAGLTGYCWTFDELLA